MSINITVDLYEYEGSVCEPLKSYIQRLQEVLRKIPPQYQDEAEIVITTWGSYGGDTYVRTDVTYERPETPDETAEREKIEKSRRLCHEETERLLYLQLKEKYGT